MDSQSGGAGRRASGDGVPIVADGFDGTCDAKPEAAPGAPDTDTAGAGGNLAAAGGDAEHGFGGAAHSDSGIGDGDDDGDDDDDFAGAVQSRRGQYARTAAADPTLLNQARASGGTVPGSVPLHVWIMGGLFLVAIIIGIVVASTASRKHELFKHHVDEDDDALPAYDDTSLVRGEGCGVARGLAGLSHGRAMHAVKAPSCSWCRVACVVHS